MKYELTTSRYGNITELVTEDELHAVCEAMDWPDTIVRHADGNLYDDGGMIAVENDEGGEGC